MLGLPPRPPKSRPAAGQPPGLGVFKPLGPPRSFSNHHSGRAERFAMGSGSGLYGGAITTYLPEGFLDTSLLREVPDTQEVYVNGREDGESYDDGLARNESVVVDLLERVEACDDLQALREHVAEICSFDGSAEAAPFAKLETLAGGQQACVVFESVDKWGKRELNETVALCVGLIRLEDVATDVVITVHVPVAGSRQSELAQGQQLPPTVVAAYRLLLRMIREFKVVDRSLFV